MQKEVLALRDMYNISTTLSEPHIVVGLLS
jgi:hypothetical protein